MPVVPPNLLTPDSVQKQYLTQNVLNDFLVFVLGGRYDWLVTQLWCASDASWSAGCVVTLECSLDGSSWSAFPTPVPGYSALGMRNPVACTGIMFVRYRVSTVGASGTVLNVLVSAGRNT